MANGIWTATSGAVAQSQNIDVIANNLANMDTPAFKKDVPTFKEYLAVQERVHDTPDIPRGPIKDKDFYPLDGRDQSYVIMDGTHTGFREGNLRVTQRPLDIALDGPGFLEVNTPAGIRYTRQGSLKMATDGRLITTDGYSVLAAQPAGLAGPAQANLNPANPPNLNNGGASVAARFINLRDKGTNFTIGTNGEIYAGENLAGRISVVEFQDLAKLRKYGGEIFENSDQNNIIPTTHTIVRQGVIETSNVNPVEEMANMIKANRLYEHDLKSIKTYGDLLGREVNDIGKL